MPGWNTSCSCLLHAKWGSNTAHTTETVLMFSLPSRQKRETGPLKTFQLLSLLIISARFEALVIVLLWKKVINYDSEGTCKKRALWNGPTVTMAVMKTSPSSSPNWGTISGQKCRALNICGFCFIPIAFNNHNCLFVTFMHMVRKTRYITQSKSRDESAQFAALHNLHEKRFWTSPWVTATRACTVLMNSDMTILAFPYIANNAPRRSKSNQARSGLNIAQKNGQCAYSYCKMF